MQSMYRHKSLSSRGFFSAPPAAEQHQTNFFFLPFIFHLSSTMPASEPPAYVGVAQRKQAQLSASIPAEWRLPAHLIPAGMLSPAESITDGPKKYGRVNVMEIPRTCGILSSQELNITEKYDVRGLVAEMTEGRLKAEEVVQGFCKVSLSFSS
jgi:hypothetical protein